MFKIGETAFVLHKLGTTFQNYWFAYILQIFLSSHVFDRCLNFDACKTPLPKGIQRKSFTDIHYWVRPTKLQNSIEIGVSAQKHWLNWRGITLVWSDYPDYP